jgi:alkanesulfonate monooxygenase SsuD/methylene tetrahydromethanopterin reductase-like flavin-dependent oxidoreductase (luciferase family)
VGAARAGPSGLSIAITRMPEKEQKIVQVGDRDGAASLVTDEMVLGTTLIGTEDMVRARLGVWRNAGVDTVRLYPAGDTLDARLTTLGRALELVREVG